ncbi:MAG: RhuM family protein, partial [Bacteroidales bacterium]
MNTSSIVFYKLEGGNTEISVILDGETVWLSLSQMTDLFQRDKSVISRHIHNIFNDGELEKISTVANFATVQIEGEREITRSIEYFNLDVIISVGYRVKSQRGIDFRIWANRILKDYLIKGYSINEKRLTQQNEQLK